MVIDRLDEIRRDRRIDKTHNATDGSRSGLRMMDNISRDITLGRRPRRRS